MRASQGDMGDDTSVEQPPEKKYPDFVICSRIIYLTRITNQITNVGLITLDMLIYSDISNNRERSYQT